MKLHAQLDAGVNIAHPRAWLFQVGTNLSKDEKRNESLQEALPTGQRYKGYCSGMRTPSKRKSFNRRSAIRCIPSESDSVVGSW